MHEESNLAFVCSILLVRCTQQTRLSRDGLATTVTDTSLREPTKPADHQGDEVNRPRSYQLVRMCERGQAKRMAKKIAADSDGS